MRTRIGTRLILGAGLSTALVIGIMAVVIVRDHASQLLFERTRSANQLSETIKSSTHFDMLENRRENLHRQIRAIGGLEQEGIRKVRVFNKEGRIMFSSDGEEIGTSLDPKGEACYACHAEGRPLEHLDIRQRARVFRGPDGTRLLGIINPIPNEPSCSTAECHAHSPRQSLLGVLDVNVSLAEVDREIARSRAVMAGAALAAILAGSLILWWLNRRLVVRPVAALVAGTRRVGEGDLSTPIPFVGRHELGELAKAFNTMVDRLSETQRQLALADKLASVGRLAAGIAHEINNPLTGVLSYASLLRKRFNADQAAAEDLDVIVRETVRCRGIIKGLLDFSRPAQPMRKPTDLNEVARRAVAVVMSQLSLRHVSLSLDLAEDLPTAQADANQIQQVVVNLLLNAADAIGEEGGTIAVSTRAAVMPPPLETDPDAAPAPGGEPSPALELTVADDGCGIPPEDLPHLFEPFFSTKGNRGTGLGLAVTWGLVEAHGGRIDVQSQPGQGARFTVRIPQAPRTDPPHPPKEVP
jgi:two-component system NtrC family sensor kinase